jgi:type 1 glutamine amidotransferase
VSEGPRRALLVCGGRWHDFDFARLELLRLLGERAEIRTRVAEDYRDLDALAGADFLVTYTCDVRPSEAEQEALAGFVAAGGRWLALHGTNSVMEFTPRGVAAPRSHPRLMETLGSRFVAHPPVGRFRVRVSQPGHPLVAGIADFDVEDELYLCELHEGNELLLETQFSGRAPGFVEAEWPDTAPRPVMYLRARGRGAVLYNTLGHCRGPWDMRPLVDVYPRVERCAWQQPVFHELLRRGIAWASSARDRKEADEVGRRAASRRRAKAGSRKG